MITCDMQGKAVHLSTKWDKYGGMCPPESSVNAAEVVEASTATKPRRSKLVRVIAKILASTPRQIHKPTFRFEATVEAAEANFRILQANGGSLEEALRNQPFNPTSFGSEFRDTATLAPLYGTHPGWPKLKSILENGSSFPMEEIDDETRLADLKIALERGNHKSAKGEKAKILVEKTTKEISMGWSLPLLVEHAPQLPNAWYAPMGIAEQATINERGEFVRSMTNLISKQSQRNRSMS